MTPLMLELLAAALASLLVSLLAMITCWQVRHKQCYRAVSLLAPSPPSLKDSTKGKQLWLTLSHSVTKPEVSKMIYHSLSLSISTKISKELCLLSATP